MARITKTLSLAEMKMLRRQGAQRISSSLLLIHILQSCTDLTAAEIFALKEQEAIDILNELFDQSLQSVSI
jgi:hypothetical protein